MMTVSAVLATELDSGRESQGQGEPSMLVAHSTSPTDTKFWRYEYMYMHVHTSM